MVDKLGFGGSWFVQKMAGRSIRLRGSEPVALPRVEIGFDEGKTMGFSGLVFFREKISQLFQIKLR